MPTGSGKLGLKLRCPQGEGVIVHVYDQDNVVVETNRTVPKVGGGSIPERWKGDVGECDAFCEPCGDYHTHEKHVKKAEVKAVA